MRILPGSAKGPGRTAWVGCLVLAAVGACTEPRGETRLEKAAAEPPAQVPPPPAAVGQVEPAPQAPPGAGTPAKPAPAPPVAPPVVQEGTRTEVAPSPTTPAARTGERVEYAPHIFIDWSVPQVRVSAQVVLREGLLELLMCAAHSKEHESILATPARPRQIFEALGLIGLQAGRPPSYEPVGQKYVPAAGERVAVEIHYSYKGEARVRGGHEWMLDAEQRKPIKPLPWLFCGSQFAGDRFGADAEGTVASLVDFDTSLLGLADRYSSDNASLWLVANTEAIPEVGTPCEVVFHRLETEPIRVMLTPELLFERDGVVLDALQLDQVIKDRIRHYPEQKLELSAADGMSGKFARFAAGAIVGSGIARENLVLDLPPEPAEEPAPVPPGGSAAGQPK